MASSLTTSTGGVISDSDDDSDFVVETPPTLTKTKALTGLNRKARKAKEEDDQQARGEDQEREERPNKKSTAFLWMGQQQQQQAKSSSPLVSPDFKVKSGAASRRFADDSLDDSPVVATTKKIGATYRKSRVILSDSESDDDQEKKVRGKRPESDSDSDSEEEEESQEEEEEDDSVESEEEEKDKRQEYGEKENSVVDLIDDDDDTDGEEEESQDRSHQSEFLPETSDESVVTLDTTEDEVVKENGKDKELILSPEEADELKGSLARNQRALQSNLKMLGHKDRLPDGGAKLQRFVDRLLGEQEELQSKLSRAKVSRRSDGVTSSDSSARSSYSPPLTAEQQKLANLKERRRILRLQFSLVRPSQLADSGASLRREISEIDMQILKLEGVAGASATPFIPLGGRKPDVSVTAPKGPLHNEEWQKFRDAIGAASVPSTWEPDIEQHNLYGGRMNMHRRQEAVKVTTVSQINNVCT